MSAGKFCRARGIEQFDEILDVGRILGAYDEHTGAFQLTTNVLDLPRPVLRTRGVVDLSTVRLREIVLPFARPT